MEETADPETGRSGSDGYVELRWPRGAVQSAQAISRGGAARKPESTVPQRDRCAGLKSTLFVANGRAAKPAPTGAQHSSVRWMCCRAHPFEVMVPPV